jgi:hypothetical protein
VFSCRDCVELELCAYLYNESVKIMYVNTDRDFIYKQSASTLFVLIPGTAIVILYVSRSRPIFTPATKTPVSVLNALTPA